MMINKAHQFKGKIWVYHGQNPWHFITIKGPVLKQILSDVVFFGGFRSVKVNVQIGKTNWKTSIFADKKGYLLPIKKSVRLIENLKAGSSPLIKLIVLK